MSFGIINLRLSNSMKAANITLFIAAFLNLFAVTNASSKELNGILSCIVREQTVLGLNEGESTFYPNFFAEEQIVELNYVYTENKELVIELGAIDLIYIGLKDELKTITNKVAVFKSLAESISFGKEYIRTKAPTSELIFKRYLSKRKNKHFWDGYMAVDIGGNGIIRSLTTLNCYDASELIDEVFDKIVRDQST